MLQWLLKYPLDWYADGRIETALGWAPTLLAAALAAAAVALFAGYRRLPGGAGPRLLRAGLVALLVITLLQPALVVDAPVPVRGHVAVLLDDSLSMRIADPDGTSGAQRVAALFGPAGSLGPRLDARFDTRYYRYGEGVHPRAPGEALAHGAARSDLAVALARVADGHDAAALAAVLVVGDGGGAGAAADDARLDAARLALRARGVPVHVLPVGAAGAGRDVEIGALTLPSMVLRGDRVDVEVEILQRGFAGATVQLILDDDGAIVDRHAVVLPADGRPLRVLRRVVLDGAGTRYLGARIEPLAGELTAENNHRESSVTVAGMPLRVLHFEAEPRFEVKFLRRALARDPGLRVASLVRTADNKYFRLGIDAPGELADGFPGTEELFRYDVLVLGSVPAELLDAGERAALNDFVVRRGGGLLLLGGRRAFAEGGYGQPPFVDLLPVRLEVPQPGFRAEVVAHATDAGRYDARLDFGDAEPLDARLARLPPLTVINPVRAAKPGATVLLEGRDARDEPLVLLAAHRFGRGRVAAFPVRNSWRWQLHADVPLEDLSHETLFRQLLRDLGRGAGGRARLVPATSRATPGEAVALRVELLDPVYRPLVGVAPAVAVTDPLGAISRLPLQRAGDGSASHVAQFVPARPGRHELSLALDEGTVARAWIDVSATGDEFLARGSDPAALARLATATGGRVFAAEAIAALPGALDDATGTRRELQRLALWDAPLLLLLILLLAAGEWALRRTRRLA